MKAEAHMLAADDAGLVWGEETITELVLAAAHPEFRNMTFTKWQSCRRGLAIVVGR
jgi:hypothetical protein